MRTIYGETIYEYEISKSTFTCYLKHVESIEEAKTFFNDIKEMHPFATHHVTTYIIGRHGENGHYNDDGEPSGTAGAPMFDVLRKNELTNLAAVSVRYFGGIKLGAGGLVRAYSKSLSEAIKQLPIEEIIDYGYLKVSFDYSLLKLIEKSLINTEILSRKFSHNVTLLLKTPVDNLNTIINIIVNLSANLAKIEVLKDSELSDEEI